MEDVVFDDWAVVIPAGGLVPDPLAAAIGTPRKALATVEGKTCVEWCVLAVSEAGFRNIAVVSGEDVREKVGPDHWVLEQSGQIENVSAGVAKFPDTHKFLFLPADTPMLTPQGITHFVQQVEARTDQASDQWLAAGLCPYKTFLQAFPGFVSPHIKLKEGDFMSGAYFAVGRSGFDRAVELVKVLSQSRKSQLKMLLRLGVWPLLQYFLHQIDLPGAERRLSKAFGATAVIVPDCDPHAMADIDTVEDFHHVLKHAKNHLKNRL